MLKRIISVAPMMGYTDRHFRYLIRLISKRTLLYTEMLTTGAILNGKKEYLLGYDSFEHPLALQVGGSNPHDLSRCAVIAQQYGYDELNLNVGCPSDRVQSGRFGACLMAEPELVGACISAMRQATSIPVTVKTRIGIDHQDSIEALYHFISTVSDAGCKTFIIHARKAWLKGLSPKENREIPPLRYDIVEQLKKDYPSLEIILNGGIKSISAITQHLQEVDGVMIGREAYQNPFLLSEVDNSFYQDKREISTRAYVLRGMADYVDKQIPSKSFVRAVGRHLMGLYQGLPGAREWRRFLSDEWPELASGPALLDRASHLGFI